MDYLENYLNCIFLNRNDWMTAKTKICSAFSSFASNSGDCLDQLQTANDTSINAFQRLLVLLVYVGQNALLIFVNMEWYAECFFLSQKHWWCM